MYGGDPTNCQSWDRYATKKSTREIAERSPSCAKTRPLLRVGLPASAGEPRPQDLGGSLGQSPPLLP